MKDPIALFQTWLKKATDSGMKELAAMFAFSRLGSAEEAMNLGQK